MGGDHAGSQEASGSWPLWLGDPTHTSRPAQQSVDARTPSRMLRVGPVSSPSAVLGGPAVAQHGDPSSANVSERPQREAGPWPATMAVVCPAAGEWPAWKLP